MTSCGVDACPLVVYEDAVWVRIDVRDVSLAEDCFFETRCDQHSAQVSTIHPYARRCWSGTFNGYLLRRVALYKAVRREAKCHLGGLRRKKQVRFCKILY